MRVWMSELCAVYSMAQTKQGREVTKEMVYALYGCYTATLHLNPHIKCFLCTVSDRIIQKIETWWTTLDSQQVDT